MQLAGSSGRTAKVWLERWEMTRVRTERAVVQRAATTVIMLGTFITLNNKKEQPAPFGEIKSRRNLTMVRMIVPLGQFHPA